jgi:hypothetical protein
MRTLRALAAVLVLTSTAGGAAAIEGPSGIDTRLHLDYDVGASRKGKTEVRGYIYNDYMRAANNVRLLVETLDASGQPVDRAYGFVVGAVPAFNRAPFTVPVKTAGSSYRITVTTYEWIDGPAAAGG